MLLDRRNATPDGGFPDSFGSVWCAFHMENGRPAHDLLPSSSFLKERISSTMPVPVRMCPMPAIPEMEAEAPADSVSPRTWVMPRTASMTAVSGTPML